MFYCVLGLIMYFCFFVDYSSLMYRDKTIVRYCCFVDCRVLISISQQENQITFELQLRSISKSHLKGYDNG